jgi:hypothetical protein
MIPITLRNNNMNKGKTWRFDPVRIKGRVCRRMRRAMKMRTRERQQMKLEVEERG